MREGARRLNPPASGSRVVARAFFEQESFRRLDTKVQAVLRGVLALVPGRAPEVEQLIGLPTFTALSREEQRALLSPPRPERLDHALALLTDPVWPALLGDKLPLFALPVRVQSALLAQFDHFPLRRTGEYLCRLTEAPWFGELEIDDQLRALKVIAFASSQLSGATEQQRPIIENTLDGLVSKTPRFTLEFELLPFDERDTVAGHRRLPCTVILNSAAIAADDDRIDGAREEHIALATLVHEANHLANGIPEGETYAAFQDEYRAWFVAFVAYMARTPSKIEALLRCQEIFSSDSYTDIQGALSHPEEAKQIFAFLAEFGEVRSLDDLKALSLDNYVLAAPLPVPRLNLDNA